MKKKLVVFFVSFFAVNMLLMALVYYLDPFFVYHKPNYKFFYKLDNERSQNYGIVRAFEYDSMITGTSLTEHYKTSMFDSLFGTDSIKVPFAGGTFHETAELVRQSYATGHNLKIVFRSFEINHLVEAPDKVRADLGFYPDYLYNDKFWDDYKYVLNIDILERYCLPMLGKRIIGQEGGHTSFDEYQYGIFGVGEFLSEREPLPMSDEQNKLGEDDIELLTSNVNANIVSLAKEHPETTFIYFIPPYNIMWWRDQAVNGDLFYMCQVMRKAVSLMLECDNIKIYSFTNETDYIMDLSLYADEYHYLNWVGEEIMEYAAADDPKYRLTKENYNEFFDKTEEMLGTFDYTSFWK